MAKATPWFALGLYSIGSAVLAALGRVGYGASYALASRYVTFSLYLAIAVIGLVAFWVSLRLPVRTFRALAIPLMLAVFLSDQAVRPRRWTHPICLLLVAAYLVPYTLTASNNWFFLRALSARDRLAHAAILFCRTLDTSEVIKKTAYPNDARPVTENADAVDRLKLWRPPLVRTNRIDSLPHEIADGRRASGSCESLTPLEGNMIRASGWAALDAKGRPPDCVAIAYQVAPDQPWTLCAISDSFAMRPEIVKRLRTMEQLWTGWSATLPRSAFPPGAQLSFWAVDADEPRLYQLKDESGGSTR